MSHRHTYAPLVVIAVLSLALAACGKAAPSSDPRIQIPLVRLATVAAADQAEQSYTGVVAARVQSDLGFRIPGKIHQRLVDAGQEVRRGQPLLRIDPSDYRLARRAADEAVAAASALARQSRDDEIRYRDLVSTGAVSTSAYERMRATAETAQAALNAARAQAEVARNEASYAVLLADASGVVVETLAEPGQVVGTGQVVVRIAHAGQREAMVQLPETLRPAVGSTGHATLYGSGAKAPATLRLLSDAANPETRTFEARYTLESTLADAPLGSTVSIRIPAQASTPSVKVPIGAIHDQGTGPGVWLLREPEFRVHWRAVQVLGLGDETASVVAELVPGDQVIALGAHLLREGEEVRIEGVGSASAAQEAAR